MTMAKPTSPQLEESHLEVFASLCTSVVLFLFTVTFIFQNFVIPSSSMASTLPHV
jgi:signal peptidase I